MDMLHKPVLPDGEPGGAGISDAGLGYYPYVDLDNGTGTVPENFVFNPKIVTDLYFSYKINKNISCNYRCR